MPRGPDHDDDRALRGSGVLMRALRGHRQRGQTIVFAAIAMVAVVGGLAMVVDVGMFLMVQRQLQTAADAGALAGAWHDRICPATSAGCLGPSDSAPTVATQIPQATADRKAGLRG